jgi:predicted nucleotidyltransferase
MSSVILKLSEKEVIKPPTWLPHAVSYETMMGSIAYGVNTDTSDTDIYGFAIPPAELIFPHLNGEIRGFGKQTAPFEQYQSHHNKHDEKSYDISIFSIIKYMNLCMEANPNMIDSLFTPLYCVLHATTIGNLVRENRRLFLSKLCWSKFKGYAYSQLHKIKEKTPTPGSKRFENVEKHGYDVKYAYHLFRLLDEVEQIMVFQDLDLTRDRERLKAIRRGEYSEESIYSVFAETEKRLERVFSESKLPEIPDEARIKELLLKCLEHHYGKLDNMVVLPSAGKMALNEIRAVLEKYGI